MTSGTQAERGALSSSSLEVGPHVVHSFHGGRPSAPPVLLLHGLGASGRYFLPLAQRLARDYSVHVPELPGHGDSSRPAHALDVPGLADVLEAWLEAAGLPDRLVIVANSMGCQVAAALCVLRPVRARAMVFVGPTFDPENRQLGRLLLRFVGTGLFERLSLPWRLLADYTRMGARRFREELRHVLADRIERYLPLVAAPTLVLRGSQDLLVSGAWATHVTGLLADGRLVTLPGWGHALHHAVPDEVADLVRAFVRSTAEPALGLPR